MSDPIYRLSNRQKKELLIRGGVIEIAIPATYALCEVGDPSPQYLIDWALARLEDVERKHIASAELIDIVIEPATRGGGLTELLGVISRPTAGQLQLVVSVVAVTLCATARPRHAPTPLAWPGSARCGDMIWPRESDATGVQ